MTQTIELSPYFERAETSREGFPAEGYVAGFREPNGATVGIEIRLPAELVERAVLVGSQLSVSLAPDGRLLLDADGLTDETLRAASAAGPVHQQTLESLVAACLDPELLAGEDDAVGDLTALRAQLVRALAQLDGALERLKQR
ncbi:MAG: hypothetical protein ACKVP3_24870 [Hyphomicrobiaceae bacterium]